MTTDCHQILNDTFHLTPNAQIVIVGDGVTGQSAARFFNSLGYHFVVVDSRVAPFTQETFKEATHLLVSPGVSLSEPLIAQALDAGAILMSDIDMFATLAQAPIIAISGANGKSTVTTMVGDMAAACGKRVGVGGNLGTPALDLLCEQTELYVLELSSFQLERTSHLNAAAASVLNISADHLDRHGDLDNYAQAKAHIFAGDGAVILNRDDERVYAMREAMRQTYTFSIKQPADFYLANQMLMHKEQILMPRSELPLEGKHNVANALAAFALANALGLDMNACKTALKCFKALDHRMQRVSEKLGFSWVNDSKATNIGACIAALEGYDEKVILIAGGDGKGSDMNELAPVIVEKAKAVILTGKDAKRIEEALQLLPSIVPAYHAQDMREVVAIASHIAQVGDTILLSPACASLDQYKNYQDRGNQFAFAIEALPA